MHKWNWKQGVVGMYVMKPLKTSYNTETGIFQADTIFLNGMTELQIFN